MLSVFVYQICSWSWSITSFCKPICMKKEDSSMVLLSSKVPAAEIKFGTFWQLNINNCYYIPVWMSSGTVKSKTCTYRCVFFPARTQRAEVCYRIGLHTPGWVTHTQTTSCKTCFHVVVGPWKTVSSGHWTLSIHIISRVTCRGPYMPSLHTPPHEPPLTWPKVQQLFHKHHKKSFATDPISQWLPI